MKHRIVIRCEGRSLRDFALKQQISKCITAALAHQGVNTPCEINVLVTDDEGIRAINNAYRKIDKATDVLSFPMFELTAGQLPASWEAYKDPDTGLVPLGDMAISIGAYSEEILIMVAISNIGNLLTPGYELSLANKWMRVMICIFALFCGVAGLSIGILIHFTLLLSTETIKFPYLYPLIPFSAREWKQILLGGPVHLSDEQRSKGRRAAPRRRAKRVK